jgi:hypothetical protein
MCCSTVKLSSAVVRLLSAAVATTMLMSGWAGKPFTYRSQNEISEGPGIFSRSLGTARGDLTSDSVNEVGEGGAGSGQSGNLAETVTTDAALFEEFQAFARWNKDKQDSAAYREFQQCREWQAYRKCRAQQSLSAERCATR